MSIQISISNAIGSRYRGSVVPPVTPLLLDTYSGAAAAYSLRKLRTAYTGNCIRVRRSSGIPAEQDFGFVNNVLDTASLLTFVGAGDGYITTWYDQSGNGNNLTRTSAVNQPYIVSAGSLVIDNGTPAVKFDGTNDSLVTTATFTQSQPITSFGLFKVSTNKNYVPVYGFGSSGSISLVDVTQYSVNSLRIGATGGSGTNFETGHILNKSINLNTYYIASALYNTPNFSFTLNNNISTGTSGVNTLSLSSNNFSIGNQFAYGYTDATVKEVVVYFGNQSANITNIEYNINSFYSVFSSGPTWNGTQSGLLNTYPNAAAAYSIRALNSAYTGPLIRVRRSSDNNEIDIFALQNGQLDTTFLLAFCGTNSGFVTTWYDQSGNSKNVTETTAANQPQIVTSGNIELLNGKPMIKFNGTSHKLTAASSIISGQFGVYGVSQTPAPASQTGIMFTQYRSFTANRFVLYTEHSTSNLMALQIGGSYDNKIGTVTNAQKLYYWNRNASNLIEYADNNSSPNSVTITTTAINQTLMFGAFEDVVFNYRPQNIQECVIYTTDSSSNRTGISSNINSFYSIY